MRPVLQCYSKTLAIICKQFLVVFLLLFSLTNSAVLDFVIRGKLVDEKGAPVPFASVIVKGTKRGLQAGEDGSFTLTVPQLPATIICSAPGFEATEKTILKKNTKDS